MLDKIRKFATKSEFNYRIIYFFYLIYEKIHMFCFLLLRVISIDENKIVFCTAGGKRYGDNPMYVSDELKKRNEKYNIVWLVKEDVKREIPKDIKCKKYNFFSEIYELATAKVWVDSNWKTSGIMKRENQCYIQTWHGSYGLKKIGADLGDILPLVDKRNNKHNSKIIDLMISNSRMTTKIYRRAFLYSGSIMECGSPRNDLFFKESKKIVEKVRNHFEIENKKIVLYAPTFRNDYRIDNFVLDYEKLCDALEKKFGLEWMVLIRLHPSNKNDAEKISKYNSKIKNASNYLFMQELLVAADILITDYSSCMFDFVTTGKPCFLYATDIEKYREERDYYFELDDLPFPLAENNEQLEENILNFDEELYRKKLNGLFEMVGLCETGHASEKVADYIEQWMKEN